MAKYNDIFIAQKETAVIEEAPDSYKAEECHYLSYHLLVKETEDTTKPHIVFDASAMSEGPSLNECLYKVPQLTPLIFYIFPRFRTFLIAMMSDIEKAFLQISVDMGDRDYLRSICFDNAFSEAPRVVRNRFSRFVFGVSSSPFSLKGTIRKHMGNNEFDEESVRKVLDSFYVDDFSGAENTVEKAF